MFVFIRYALPADLSDKLFDIPLGTFYEKDVDDDFACMVSDDFDHLDGIYNEVRRQGWCFSIDDIEDEELKEEAESYYMVYEARVYDL